MQRAGRQKRRAFTLLELIAVLVLFGLIATITMFSVVGHFEQSELIRISQLLANADRKERDAVRQSPIPGALFFDRPKQRFEYKCSGGKIELGKRVKSADVISISPQANDKSILFAQSGQSPTYAIRLESHRGAFYWVLIIGLTGQVLFTDSIDDVRSYMAMGR